MEQGGGIERAGTREQHTRTEWNERTGWETRAGRACMQCGQTVHACNEGCRACAAVHALPCMRVGRSGALPVLTIRCTR